jgi:hypothetical protein
LADAKLAFFRAKSLVAGVGSVDNDFDQDGAAPNADADTDGNCPLTGAADALGQSTCGGLMAPQSIVGDGLLLRGDIGRIGVGGPASADYDRDGCPDVAEVLDVNGDRVANGGDKLSLDRAVAGKLAWAPPAFISSIEVVVFDTNGDGTINNVDQLAAARVIAGKYGPINLDCKATAIGINAN